MSDPDRPPAGVADVMRLHGVDLATYVPPIVTSANTAPLPPAPIAVEPFVLVCAFRYALGRMSVAAGAIADVLIARRDQLPASDRALIVREIGQALDRGQAGMDCDAEQWRRVAEALGGDQ